MNLDNEELKVTKENQEKYTINVPLITNQELEEIDIHYNDYIEEVVKAVTHEKDLIVLQEIIKVQKRRIEKDYISKYKIREIINNSYPDIAIEKLMNLLEE